ncbi:MAG: major facilitator superfamily domain-containing protein [Benniella sp.]|nr:MAG: major facilitator superfamily domain-containing protein [Benniella sp.]
MVSSTNLVDHAQGQTYVTYKSRFVGLFAIVLLNISTGFVWLTYSSVQKAAQGYFNIDDSTIIDVTSILYFVAFLIMSPVSGWMFEKKGIKKSLLFGAGVQLVGTLLRYFSHFIESTPESPGGRIALTLVGQVIAAAAQPFFLNVPPKYAAVWFSETGRTTATMIGSVANAFAAALAQLVIPEITTDKDSMSTSVLVCVILSVVAIIPVLFMKERPPTPPSPSAEQALLETKEEPFWVSLKKVGTNKQFLILMFLFGTFVGFFNAFSSLISQFAEPFGYDATESGYFGAAMIVAGLVGAGIAGPVIDRNKQFKSLMKTMVPLATLFYIIFVFVVRKDFLVGILVASALLGLFSFALLPVVLELGVECTYPVTPASSTALLWSSGQFFAVIFLIILGQLKGDPEKVRDTGINPPLIFIAAWCVLATFPVYLFKSPYYRLEAEARARANNNVAGDKQESDMQEIALGNDTKA